MNLFRSKMTTAIVRNSANRSHFRRTTLRAGTACLFVLVASFLAGVGTARGHSLPTFAAEVSANVTFFPCDPSTGICPNTGTGTGYATGLGAITVTSQTFRVGPFVPCAPLYGTRTITTDSGSIFFASNRNGVHEWRRCYRRGPELDNYGRLWGLR
jgi:hypothetical protein